MASRTNTNATSIARDKNNVSCVNPEHYGKNRHCPSPGRKKKTPTLVGIKLERPINCYLLVVMTLGLLVMLQWVVLEQVMIVYHQHWTIFPGRALLPDDVSQHGGMTQVIQEYPMRIRTVMQNHRLSKLAGESEDDRQKLPRQRITNTGKLRQQPYESIQNSSSLKFSNSGSSLRKKSRLVSNDHTNFSDKTSMGPQFDIDLNTILKLQNFYAKHQVQNCDALFSFKSILSVPETECISHSTLGWNSCNFGNVTVHTSEIVGPVGGEPIEKTDSRREDDELLRFEPGAFVTTHLASLDHMIRTNNGTELNHVVTSFLWMNLSHVPVPTTGNSERMMFRKGPTLLVKRGDYANPCMAFASIYNCFVVMRKYNLHSPRIVWLDGRAEGKLDLLWRTIFKDAVHVKELRSGELLQDTILVNTQSAFGDEGIKLSRVGQACSRNTSLHQFRDFFLQKFGITRSNEKGNRLTLLVRKHYKAHPRSDGMTDRTIYNITDDVEYIQSLYPSLTVQVKSFEEIPFDDQLRIIASTDVLVAVHGAGNIHAIFLPDHARFIEYFPDGFTDRMRFAYLSQSLGMQYFSKKAFTVRSYSGNKISVQLRPKRELSDKSRPNGTVHHVEHPTPAEAVSL